MEQPEFEPIAVLRIPVVLLRNAAEPTTVLHTPVVLKKSEHTPIAVLLFPLKFLYRER